MAEKTFLDLLANHIIDVGLQLDRLAGDKATMFASETDAHIAAWQQVLATLLLTSQVERVAQVLEDFYDTWKVVEGMSDAQA